MKCFLILFFILLSFSSLGLEGLDVTKLSESEQSFVNHLKTQGFQNIYDRDKEGRTSLHSAVRIKDINAIFFLKREGLDMNVKDDFESRPLHSAPTEEVAQVLIELGADIHARNKYGESPLHTASYNGYPEVVAVLLKKGADVHAEDKYGQRALHRAAQSLFPKESIEIFNMLLSANAKISARNKNGQTALLQTQSKEEAEFLINAGAEINSTNKDGQTLLHLAYYKGDEKTSEFLISAGADFDWVDNYGNKPIHYKGAGAVPLRSSHQAGKKPTKLLPFEAIDESKYLNSASFSVADKRAACFRTIKKKRRRKYRAGGIRYSNRFRKR